MSPEAVLLGAPNQKDENGVQVSFGTAADLLDWALDRFETGSLPETGQALAAQNHYAVLWMHPDETTSRSADWPQ